MSVVVLGCGPAGLLAAHGATMADAGPVKIVSKLLPSFISGAQYMHVEIPGLGDIPKGQLKYEYLGEKEVYAAKVYGDPQAPCSWGKFPEYCDYWPMQVVYKRLWEMYSDRIVHCVVTPAQVELFIERFDHVISSIPLTVLAGPGMSHHFWKAKVWITEDTFTSPETIVYNGLPDGKWYRTSNIARHWSTEYSEHPYPLEEGTSVREITKPLHADVDPFGDQILKVGRYGKWIKEELAHDAYFDTIRWLCARTGSDYQTLLERAPV